MDKQEEKNRGILLSWISYCFQFIEYSIETLQLNTFLLNNYYTIMNVRLTIIYTILLSVHYYYNQLFKNKRTIKQPHMFINYSFFVINSSNTLLYCLIKVFKVILFNGKHSELVLCTRYKNHKMNPQHLVMAGYAEFDSFCKM